MQQSPEQWEQPPPHTYYPPQQGNQQWQQSSMYPSPIPVRQPLKKSIVGVVVSILSVVLDVISCISFILFLISDSIFILSCIYLSLGAIAFGSFGCYYLFKDWPKGKMTGAKAASICGLTFGVILASLSFCLLLIFWAFRSG